MKPICLISARGGSKGVPKKNIREFGKKPLIAHSIEKCINSKIFSEVIVSTEDSTIAKIAKKYGANVPFMRPKKLAMDNSSMDEVVYHAVKKLIKLDYKFDTIISLDCTVPFLRIIDMKKAVNLIHKKEVDLVLGVYKQHHNPYFNMMELDKDGYLQFSKKLKDRIKSRQEAPAVYQVNGLFVINVKQFLKYKKIYMPKIIPYEIPVETGFMIDTEFEFQVASMVKDKKIDLKK
jgi:CMP-N,N'-diacetyllegionaminic acid synthase